MYTFVLLVVVIIVVVCGVVVVVVDVSVDPGAVADEFPELPSPPQAATPAAATTAAMNSITRRSRVTGPR